MTSLKFVLIPLLIFNTILAPLAAATNDTKLPKSAPPAARKFVAHHRTLARSHILDQEALLEVMAEQLAEQFADPFAEMLINGTVSTDWMLGGFEAQYAPEKVKALSPALRAFAAFEAVRDISLHPEIVSRISDIRQFHINKWKRRGVIALKTTAAIAAIAIMIAVTVAIIAATKGESSDSSSSSDDGPFSGVTGWWFAESTAHVVGGMAELAYDSAFTYNSGPTLEEQLANMNPQAAHEIFTKQLRTNPLFKKFLDKVNEKLASRTDVKVPGADRTFFRRRWLTKEIENRLLVPFAIAKQEQAAELATNAYATQEFKTERVENDPEKLRAIAGETFEQARTRINLNAAAEAERADPLEEEFLHLEERADCRAPLTSGKK